MCFAKHSTSSTQLHHERIEKMRSTNASYDSSTFPSLSLFKDVYLICDSCNSVTSYYSKRNGNPTLMNSSIWIDPERSVSEEKKTVWKVVGDRAILPLKSIFLTYPMRANACCSSWKSIDPLLSVSKKSKASFHLHTSSRRDLNSLKSICPLDINRQP